MAIYEFKLTDLDGKDHVVERRFKMGEAPETLVIEHQGVNYQAKRIMSLPASMKLNWEVKDMASDLPPENYKGTL